MKPFAYTDSIALAELPDHLDENCRPIAGGTDLLPRLKAGISRADGLIDLRGAGLSDAITKRDDTVSIGALASLSTIRECLLLQRLYPMLPQAAALAATTQIRNRATLGGNLLQRPRCWYYRDPDLTCWLKQSRDGPPPTAGEPCPARSGRNSRHAIFGESVCRAVHPSDLAPCLVAAGAQVRLRGRTGERVVPIDRFFREPGDDHRRETVIHATEIVEAVDLPIPAGNTRSVYVKSMERSAWAFALVSCAMQIEFDHDAETIRSARVVLGGVATIPWRLPGLEAALRGMHPGDEPAWDAIQEAVSSAQPLAENRYKVRLSARLLGQALRTLGALTGASRGGEM